MRNILKEFEFCVVDLETTGLSPENSEIIEVGAVKIKNGLPDTTFQKFVQPENPIPEKITQITGITNDDVKEANSVQAVLDEFKDFADNSIYVAHNAKFDLSFLRAYHHERLQVESIDTLRVARKLISLSSHSLGTLTDHFDISIENAHRALDDADATARLFLKLSEQIQSDLDLIRCKFPQPIIKKAGINFSEPSISNPDQQHSNHDQFCNHWIFYALYEMEGKLGIHKLAKILAGSDDQTVQKYKHLNSYGKLFNLTQKKIVNRIKKLVEEGFLRRNSDDSYPVLDLTKSSLQRLQKNSI